ncbi:hypothetical protein [Peribacillus butanolivorans]
MNEKIAITYKSFIYLLISIVTALVLLYFCTTTIIELVKKDKEWLDTTIGAIGNIAGGLIGGIVAYIVASYQVKSSTEEQKRLSLRSTYGNIRLIKEEVSYNLKVIESVIPYEKNKDNNTLLENELQNTQWLNSANNLGPEVPNGSFTALCEHYRQIAVLKNTGTIDKNVVFVEKTKDKAKEILSDLDNLTNNIVNKI